MATLKEIRAAFPQYANVPDDVLSDALFKKYGEGQEKADFLLELQGRGPRIGSFEASKERLKGSLETGIARVLQGAGAEKKAAEWAESAAERREDVGARYQPRIRSYEDIESVADLPEYAGQLIAGSAPQTALTLAGAGIGALLTRKPAVARAGLSRLSGASLGGGAASFPAYFGANIERQMEGGETLAETDVVPAALSALGQSALDSVGLRVLFRGIPGLSELAPAAQASRIGRAATRALETGATEALTETAQQSLEMLQADPNKFFSFAPEVQKELIEAAIGGGLVGGVLGGAAGVVSRGPRPTAPAAEEAAPVAEEQPQREELLALPAPEAAQAAPVQEGEAGVPVEAETPAMAPAPRMPAEGEAAAAVEPGAAVEPVPAEPAAVEPAAAPEPVKTPEIPAIKPETVRLFTIPEPPALPKILKAGEPVTGGYSIKFPTDIDRALFQVSKPTLTKRDREYKNWLMDQGLTEQEIADFGKEFRASLNQQAKAGPGEGVLTPPRFVPSSVLQAVGQPAAPTVTAPTAEPDQIPAAPVAAPPAAEPVQVAPTPVAPKPAAAAAAPSPTVQEPPAPPPAQTAPFVRAPSNYKISKPFEAELDGYLPGINGVLREIQQNLFPGTDMQVVRAQGRARYRGRMQVSIGGATPNSMVMRLNIDALKDEFRDPKTFRAKLLHTIFHEMAHPVEYFYVANLDNQTLTAVLQQYVKERNPNSMQRSFIVKGLIDSKRGGDLELVLQNMLKATGLTRQQYNNFLKSQSAATGDAQIRAQEFGSRYQRSFSEWVAEKGAEYYTKNLEQLVPKTVFEKFQKDVLELLRDLYSRIAKFLGMPDTEGAFEVMMKDRYGKVKKTPLATAAALQRLQQRPEYIRDKGRALDTAEEVTVAAEDAATQAAPSNVAAAQAKLAGAYTAPQKMGFQGFMQAVRQAYESGSYKNLGDKITRAVSDRFIDLRRLDERYAAFLRSQGRKIQAAYDKRYEIAANLSSYAGILARENVLGMLESVLKYGGVPIIKKFSGDPLDGVLTVSREGGQPGLSFLGDLVRKDKLDAFKYYAMAKRVLGRYANKQAPITQQEARDIVSFYEKDPDVVSAYKAYQDFNKAMMKMAVDAGVISQDVADEFTKHNDYYPFYREMDETGKYTGPLFTSGVLTRTKIQQAVGGTAQLEADPIEVIMKNAQFWMHSASKNLASRKIFMMMEALGEAREIKKGERLAPGEIEGVTRENGKEKYFAVANPDIAAALETTGAHQLPSWTGVPGKFTQFYRELVTRSPDFILKNIIRDPLNAFVTSGVSFNPFAAMDNFRKALVNPQSRAELIALQNYGIIGGFRTIPGTEDATQLLNTTFKPMSNGIYVVPNGNVLTGILSRAWNAMGTAAEASDASTRMEIYKRVLEATGNEAEAAFRAQEVINFRKQGASSLVRYLSILVPFINGRIQGLDVTARAFSTDFKKTLVKGLYLTGVSMALQALMGDDEEYQQLPDYIRYGSMPVPLKLLGLGDSGFLAIPKPFEIGFIFQTFPEVLAQAAMGNVENREIAKVAWEQLKTTFGIALFPQIVSPIFEVLLNRSNMTGLPIVTDAMKNLPAELQYTSATSDIVKNLAGSVGLSPVQVEALIKGYGGQIITSLLGVVDGMYRAASGTGVDKDWTQYPTVSTFLKTQANTNPKGVSDVYRLSAEIQGLTTAINTYMAQGMADKAVALLKENEGLFTLKSSVSGLRTQLNTLSRQERMILNNPNIPQAAKEAQLEQIKEARRQIGRAMSQLIPFTGK